MRQRRGRHVRVRPRSPASRGCTSRTGTRRAKISIARSFGTSSSKTCGTARRSIPRSRESTSSCSAVISRGRASPRSTRRRRSTSWTPCSPRSASAPNTCSSSRETTTSTAMPSRSCPRCCRTHSVTRRPSRGGSRTRRNGRAPWTIWRRSRASWRATTGSRHRFTRACAPGRSMGAAWRSWGSTAHGCAGATKPRRMRSMITARSSSASRSFTMRWSAGRTRICASASCTTPSSGSRDSIATAWKGVCSTPHISCCAATRTTPRSSRRTVPTARASCSPPALRTIAARRPSVTPTPTISFASTSIRARERSSCAGGVIH